MPVRLPRKLLERAPSSAWPLGPIIFVVCEFQIIDRDTEAANEQGEASHAKYKDRQKRAVIRRLQLGMREMKVPPGLHHEAPASAAPTTPPAAAAPPSPPAPPARGSIPPPATARGGSIPPPAPARGSIPPPGGKKKR
jgi:hypothetical protein